MIGEDSFFFDLKIRFCQSPFRALAVFTVISQRGNAPLCPLGPTPSYITTHWWYLHTRNLLCEKWTSHLHRNKTRTAPVRLAPNAEHLHTYICFTKFSQCSKAAFTSIFVHISAVCILSQEVCQHGRNKSVAVTDPVQSDNNAIRWKEIGLVNNSTCISRYCLLVACTTFNFSALWIGRRIPS